MEPSPVPTMQGMPNSREMIAAWHVRPPLSVTMAAAIFMMEMGDSDRACRFDVVEVVAGAGGDLRAALIKDAFDLG